MKQSTKLLSLVLALILAFSCFSVIGNAALVPAEVAYDNIDDADLTPEQVADLALDLVDNDVLNGEMADIELSIVGTLKLSSVDDTLSSLYDLSTNFWFTILSWAVGDLGDMEFGAIKGVERAGGDLNVIYALLEFLNDNKAIVSKIVYGIGTSDGITLGSIVNGLLGDSFTEINEVLENLPGFLTSTVYDMLLYGSYDYPDDSESLDSLPDNANTIDKVLRQALVGLLLDPQEYTWEGEGETATKEWDATSYIMTLADFGVSSEDELWNLINPLSLSLFDILDNIAQPAIDKFGIPALNYNLKKNLMEACEIEFNEIDKSSIKDDSVVAEFDAEEYVNYIAYDCLLKGSNGAWYYTTLETEVVDVDEEGNEIKERVRKYFKANMAAGNEFAEMINWDWKFVTSDSSEEGTQIIYGAPDDVGNYPEDSLRGADGTIAGGINWLLGKVYDTALSEKVKEDYEDVIGGYVYGGNENLTENLTNLAAYVLGNFGEKIWGKDSKYADETVYGVDFWYGLDIVQMVAVIGPELFEDAMPQILLPQNEDGDYFEIEQGGDSSTILWEFAAVVLRELFTGIAPNVNYDEFIFAEGTLTAGGAGRQYADHTADEWFNIIVNMAMDVAYTYLYNISNFANDYSADAYNGTDGAHPIPTPTAASVVTEDRWMDMLDDVINWTVEYVGENITETDTAKYGDTPAGAYGLLAGIDPVVISNMDGDPIGKLNYIFNTILPLGFIGPAYTEEDGIDLNLVIDAVKTLLTEFDLTVITNLFGRNTETDLNILGTKSLASSILRLVNDILYLVFGQTVLQSVQTDGQTAQSIDAVVTQENLKTTIQVLLGALYTRKESILISALPVVGKLISGWGTEQEYKTPTIELGETFTLTDGAVTDQSVEIRNRAEGVWRHYKDADGNSYTDNQYKIVPKTLVAYNYDGSVATNVTTTLNGVDTDIEYGKTGSFTFTVSGVSTAGQLVRFRFGYQVKDEDGALMADGKIYYIDTITYMAYSQSDSGTANSAQGNDDRGVEWGSHITYVNLSNMPESFQRAGVLWFKRAQQNLVGKTTIKFEGSGEGQSFTSTEITMNNGDREWYDVAPFGNNEKLAEGDNASSDTEQHTITFTSTFDQSAWDALGRKSGDNGSYTINVSGTKKKLIGSGGTSYTGTVTGTMTYYDGAYLNSLKELVTDELNALRKANENYYNITGYSYADSLLTYVDSTDSKGEKVLRQSNYDETAWVDDDKNVYTTVTNIVETEDKNGVVIAATGEAVNSEGETVAVKKVTVIDNAEVWANYNTELQASARVAMESFHQTNKTDWDFQGHYEALRVYTNDVQYLEKTQEELVEDGVVVESNDTYIDEMKALLTEYENATTDVYDYTDYKMYRLNRFNDARDDARDYINLKKDASYSSVDAIDGDFYYNYMNKADLKAFFDATANKTYAASNTAILTNSNVDSSIIMALVETLDEEALAEREDWLASRKVEYATTTRLDIEMAENILTRTYQRLLKRDGAGTYTQHLQAEIDSANNQIGKTNTGYTETSWNSYIEALEYAEEIVQGDSQKLMFDAKYNLLVERKELVKVEDEGDYTELVTLMEQARQALANQDLYNNTAKEFGQVLAELGMDPVMHADGYEVQLFPGSAELVLAEGYGAEDQHKIDRAATALKEALARLEFASKTVTGATVEKMVIVEGNEEEGIEEVAIEKAAIVDANLTPDDVKEYFTVTADGEAIVKENITVSRDVNYTVETDSEMGLAGTNATVTFYKDVEGVKIPVLTFKLIVMGDINGDGTVDVLDAAYGALVANDKTDLSGCYLLAGDMADDDKIVGTADYSAIVNKAVA